MNEAPLVLVDQPMNRIPGGDKIVKRLAVIARSPPAWKDGVAISLALFNKWMRLLRPRAGSTESPRSELGLKPPGFVGMARNDTIERGLAPPLSLHNSMLYFGADCMIFITSAIDSTGFTWNLT